MKILEKYSIFVMNERKNMKYVKLFESFFKSESKNRKDLEEYSNLYLIHLKI